MIQRRIFLSAPFSSNNLEPEQLATKNHILQALEEANLEPQEFYVSGRPAHLSWSFDRAQDVMSRSHGAIICALTRWRFQNDDRQVLMSTEYNHFEGALAIAAQLPTLIIKAHGVTDRGIAWDGGGRLIVNLPENPDEAYFRSREFRHHFEHWRKAVEARKDVFLGYSSGAENTANAVIKYLSTLSVSVMDWATDFQAGPSILERIEEASRSCLCGVFLFTRDDLLEGNGGAAAPRDNVVLEAGYFLKAKGRERVALVIEKGAKVPADVSGNIYIFLEDRTKVASIETKLQRFLKDAL